MSTTIPVRELRNHYRQVIDRVRAGERITVVAEGEPVVDLVPHVSDTAPPRFRPTAAHPTWGVVSPANAREWSSDIRDMSEVVDDAVTDPWGPR